MEWAKLKSEEDRLASERQEAFAKILRLEQQQKQLCTKGAEMLRCGLNSLDELEEVEWQEQEEEKASEHANQLPSLNNLSPELADQGSKALEQAWRDLVDGSTAQPASQT